MGILRTKYALCLCLICAVYLSTSYKSFMNTIFRLPTTKTSTSREDFQDILLGGHYNAATRKYIPQRFLNGEHDNASDGKRTY